MSGDILRCHNWGISGLLPAARWAKTGDVAKHPAMHKEPPQKDFLDSKCQKC